MLSKKQLKLIKDLVFAWGIDNDSWYLTGENSYVLSGYPISVRDGQADLLLLASAWPWSIVKDGYSYLPPKGSLADKELKKFNKKTGICLDFHLLPVHGIKESSVFTDCYPYKIGKNDYINVIHPWADVGHRRLICNYLIKHNQLDHFDISKFLRWKDFVQNIKNIALQKADKKALLYCSRSLKVIDKVINLFKKREVAGFDNKKIMGIVASRGRVVGKALHLNDSLKKIPKGSIVVCNHVMLRDYGLLRNALGIVCEQGGINSHAAIFSREMGIPCMVGVREALLKINNNDEIILDAVKGEISLV